MTNTLSSAPQIVENDPVEKSLPQKGLGVADGSASDHSPSQEEDPWWRTFQLWKVKMRGLEDDEPS
jgi:hypothetical protein